MDAREQGSTQEQAAEAAGQYMSPSRTSSSHPLDAPPA
jgi:hypothetical protein